MVPSFFVTYVSRDIKFKYPYAPHLIMTGKLSEVKVEVTVKEIKDTLELVKRVKNIVRAIGVMVELAVREIDSLIWCIERELEGMGSKKR